MPLPKTEDAHRQRRFETVCCWALLASIVAASIYRAITQAITMDEAYTYLGFVQRRLPELFTVYDANHHILYTLFAKLTTNLFGLSEFTLRLPSLCGGILYLVFFLKLCFRWFGRSLTALLAFLLACINPLVFDFLSAARGYGLGLGFLMVCLYLLAAEPHRRRAPLAGCFAGLAVATNLTYAVPVAAFAVVLAWQGGVSRRSVAQALRYAVPAAVIAIVIVLPPILHATQTPFQAGHDRVELMFDDLVKHILVHHPAQPNGWFAEVDFSRHLISILKGIAVALLVYCGLFLGRLAPSNPAFALSGGCLAISVALIWIAHGTTGLRFPESRMLLYAVPLLVFAGATAVHAHPKLRGLAAALGIVFLAQMSLQLCGRHYSPWHFDEAVNRIADRLIALSRTRNHPIKIVASWTLSPCLEFYRVAHHVESWKPLEGYSITPLEGDFLVLDPGIDQALLENTGFRPLYKDASAGTTLGIPTGIDPVLETRLDACAPQSTPRIIAVVDMASGRGLAAPLSLMKLRAVGLPRLETPWTASPANGIYPLRAGCFAVHVNGVSVPLTSASREEISFEMPANIGGPVATISITSGGPESAPVALETEPAAPALFTSPSNMARGTLSQSGEVFTQNHAPAPGQIISLYGTGFGVTEPEQLAGRVAVGPRPLKGKCTARIGGLAADVLYAGSAPGHIVGLTQINLRIPPVTPPGLQPVSIEMNGRSTQPGVQVPVRGRT